MLERVLVCLLAQGHLLIEGVPGPREDADDQDDRGGARRLVLAHPVHARPRPLRPRRHAHLPGRRGHLRHRARPGVLQLPARRRDQPRAGEGAVGAARGDAGAAGDDRPRHPSGARPVPRDGDAEPDRVGGHLPAPRGAGRPLHAEDPDRLPVARRGADDRPAPARGAAGAARDAHARRPARPPAARSSTSTSIPALVSYSVTLADATRNPAAHGLDDLAGVHRLRRQPARADQPRPVGAGARAAPRPRLRRRSTTSTRSRTTRCATGSCSRTRRSRRR